jgi:hypothetical protein
MILYSNSCSFGAPNQGHLIYPDIVASALGATLVNEGQARSCNRRIIRSSLRSLIQLKENANEITALIGLSFISRTELWQPHIKFAVGCDGDFHPLWSKDISNLDWSKGLLGNIYPDIFKLADHKVRDYYKQWLLHMSKEAEVTNLVSDVIMLESFAAANNIRILIFCNTQKLPGLPEVDIHAPFLQDFVKYVKINNSVIDLWNFSFADYALSLGYEPKDKHRYGLNGHPGEDAHIAFGNYLLENYV